MCRVLESMRVDYFIKFRGVGFYLKNCNSETRKNLYKKFNEVSNRVNHYVWEAYEMPINQGEKMYSSINLVFALGAVKIAPGLFTVNERPISHSAKRRLLN